MTASQDKECRRHMKELLAGSPEVTSAGLVGPDGFEVASVSLNDIAISKVAALTSTIAAVSQALAREVGLTECQDLILESESGRVLFMDVAAGDKSCTLFVVTSKEALLGKVLAQTRMLVRQLVAVLLAG